MIPVQDLVGAGHLQEAIFTLHWGKIDPSEFPTAGVNRQILYNAQLRLEELQVLPIKLGSLLEKRNFSHVQPVQVNVGGPPIFRYSKTPETWPIVQLGAGVFSAHQCGKGYLWEDFLSFILPVTEDFISAYPGDFNTMTDLIHFELRYRNIMITGQESPLEFLNAATHLKINIPSAVLNTPNVDPLIRGSRFNFGQRTTVPEGMRMVDFVQGQFDEDQKVGYVLDISMKSLGSEGISIEHQKQWLEDAHLNIRAAYRAITGYEPASS